MTRSRSDRPDRFAFDFDAHGPAVMDLLSQHEAFLRAIFDAPDDDTPRLVYADFLQENGEEDRAEFIRVQCELVAEPWSVADTRQDELSKAEARLRCKLWPDTVRESTYAPRSFVRGFESESNVLLEGFDLYHVFNLRQRIVRYDPHWFGAATLRVLVQQPHETTLLDPARVNAIFTLAAFARITTLGLGGYRSEVEDPEGDGIQSITVTQPTVSLPGIHALAANKAVRRLTELDLTHNDLDDNAALALVNSPYLDNLKRLQLLEGNHFGAKARQQVIERFGEGVVG